MWLAAEQRRSHPPPHASPAPPKRKNGSATDPERSVSAAAASRPKTWPTLNPEKTTPTVRERSVTGTVEARTSVSAAEQRPRTGLDVHRVAVSEMRVGMDGRGVRGQRRAVVALSLLRTSWCEPLPQAHDGSAGSQRGRPPHGEGRQHRRLRWCGGSTRREARADSIEPQLTERRCASAPQLQ